MTIASILTDDFIERVVNELEYRIFAKVGLSDDSRLMVRSIVRAVLNDERFHTYRFVVEVKAIDEETAKCRVRDAFEPDPTCQLPDGIALFEPTSHDWQPLPATDVIRHTVTYEAFPPPGPPNPLVRTPGRYTG